MRQNCDMRLSYEEERQFQSSPCCHICNGIFGEDEVKVRDHDHMTGEFRGAAHVKCNINYFNNRYLPVVMHNLRGYDGHLIIKNAYNITG